MNGKKINLVNKFKELVKEEVIKDKVQAKIMENMSNYKETNNNMNNNINNKKKVINRMMDVLKTAKISNEGYNSSHEPFFQNDENMAKELSKFIMETREIKEKENIRRKIPKK